MVEVGANKSPTLRISEGWAGRVSSSAVRGILAALLLRPRKARTDLNLRTLRVNSFPMRPICAHILHRGMGAIPTPCRSGPEAFEMPYKDLQRKQEWELRHRSQRLARRRELRRIEAARKEAQPQVAEVQNSGAGILLPLVAGGALAAAYNPKLAVAQEALRCSRPLSIRRAGAGGLWG